MKELLERVKEYNKENIHYEAPYLDADDMKKIEKALEKQIPKKITHEATIYKSCTCPYCKNSVDKFETFGNTKVRVTFNYCHFCGQKLDWD